MLVQDILSLRYVVLVMMITSSTTLLLRSRSRLEKGIHPIVQGSKRDLVGAEAAEAAEAAEGQVLILGRTEREVVHYSNPPISSTQSRVSCHLPSGR
ncbi:hypothetical protein CC80DRAFT_202706 [Byssothecium circinans]|uniref:Uncharacterized protein n=1 Tax=Byssothecium circinans TaxID=147558 RepID=A0A6A5TH72_9PLEO|nr:hypothetical protein CC80DRAFT_202706 [Byssothecium circinans]